MGSPWRKIKTLKDIKGAQKGPRQGKRDKWVAVRVFAPANAQAPRLLLSLKRNSFEPSPQQLFLLCSSNSSKMDPLKSSLDKACLLVWVMMGDQPDSDTESYKLPRVKKAIGLNTTFRIVIDGLVKTGSDMNSWAWYAGRKTFIPLWHIDVLLISKFCPKPKTVREAVEKIFGAYLHGRGVLNTLCFNYTCGKFRGPKLQVLLHAWWHFADQDLTVNADSSVKGTSVKGSTATAYDYPANSRRRGIFYCKFAIGTDHIADRYKASKICVPSDSLDAVKGAATPFCSVFQERHSASKGIHGVFSNNSARVQR
ncbi:hypothetical protein FH972_008762 [Carpinus fangiana]|uniref:Uncharacterized protein n=1 Tax=Carpinus fangiana TaxID=176857 RepID=A0A5N6R2G5_9ROSI|nr:hypothetical protein FH972_008762 [Carpinus fangiana]